MAEKSKLFELHPAEHPRIGRLRSQVLALPVDEDDRAALLASIDRHADEILARPLPDGADGWDDFEALEQQTLGDWLEQALERLCSRIHSLH